MDIEKLLSEKNFVMSAEVFPPKHNGEFESIIRTLRKLKTEVMPDYISITYGANGSGAETTADAASVAVDAFDFFTVAHMTAVNMTMEKLETTMQMLSRKNIKNILVLRGDIAEGSRFYQFNHANQLADYIKKHYPGFFLMGACYPEGHPDAPSLDADIDTLKLKMDCGIEHFISQMFFDNSLFYRFMDKAAAKGINLSVEAGIMPITNAKQIGRSVNMSGATLPDSFKTIISEDPLQMFESGTDYAIAQIRDLAAHGVKGIHLYTMNSPKTAKKIFDACADLRK